MCTDLHMISTIEHGRAGHALRLSGQLVPEHKPTVMSIHILSTLSHRGSHHIHTCATDVNILKNFSGAHARSSPRNHVQPQF